MNDIMIFLTLITLLLFQIPQQFGRSSMKTCQLEIFKCLTGVECLVNPGINCYSIAKIRQPGRKSQGIDIFVNI